MVNKKIIFWKIITAIILLVIFVVPIRMSADVVSGTPTSSKLVPDCGVTGRPCTLCHFIVGFHNLVQYGLYWVITFALVGIFISGVMYILSAGNEKMITDAKSFMKASLIGFVVVAGAWMIVNTTLQVLSANTDLGVGATNWYTFNCN
ncbi:MAG TPA: hypothetical protein VF390_01520 [Patescibacteria group bacterium]